MNKRKLITVVATISVITVLTTTTVFAHSKETKNIKPVNSTVLNKTKEFKYENIVKPALDELVANGIITSDQEALIIKALNPEHKPQPRNEGNMNDGIVLINYVDQMVENPMGHTNKYKTSLDNLVSAGNITQEQEDAVIKALKTAMTQNVAKPALDELVTKNIITSDQEELILKALNPEHKPQPRNIINMNEGIMLISEKPNYDEPVAQKPVEYISEYRVALDNLVSTGNITKEQEDAVINTLKQVMPQYHVHVNHINKDHSGFVK